MITLSSSIEKILKEKLMKGEPTLSELAINWGKIVGEYFSKYSYPKKFYIDKNNKKKILVLGTNNHYFSTELFYQRDILLKRVNNYFGHPVVEKIILYK